MQIVADGATTPARVELLDAAGQASIPDDALPVVLECLQTPPPEWLRPLITSREVANPYTGTTQFYVAGHTALDLPSGTYQLRIFKGNEYRVAEREVRVDAGGERSLDVALERWTDPAADGWYGSDDHIHLSRYRAADNPWLAAWMRAEGLRVANLLQMGTAEQFAVNPQYAFGDAGVYRSDGARLFAGQEHPRTHFLGHTITLGAREAIDLRDNYIVYSGFWRESQRLGGVSGFAHLGQGPAQDGLAISAPSGGVHFIEVLQWDFPRYLVWYELLNLGFRIAPSAGTDFPCIPSLPGRERVYVQVDGALSRVAYVDGLRRGRTFVTNGPVLSLRVDGAGIGDELLLEAPRSVRAVGSVHFDPERDDVRSLELVLGGVVVASAQRPDAPGHLTLTADVPIEHSSWLALRADGIKLDELPFVPVEPPEWVGRIASGFSFEGQTEFLSRLQHRPAAAHTGAVYVEVPGSIAPGRAELAGEWVARLDALEARLADAHIAEIPIWDWMPYSDGVSEAHLRRNRPALLDDIERARAHFRGLAEAADAGGDGP